jgi:hypothetical protein
MIEINGKVYPFWSQLVEKKDQFIGCELEDLGDSMDRAIFGSDANKKTVVTDVILRENGNDSAWFNITGKDFSCGFDVRCGGITAGNEGYITFSGYGGHIFRIKTKKVLQ